MINFFEIADNEKNYYLPGSIVAPERGNIPIRDDWPCSRNARSSRKRTAEMLRKFDYSLLMNEMKQANFLETNPCLNEME